MSNELPQETIREILYLLQQGKSASLIASMLKLSYDKVIEVQKSHQNK